MRWRKLAVLLPALLALFLAAGCGKADSTRGGDPGGEFSVSDLLGTSVPAGAHGPGLALAVARSLLGAVRVPGEAVPVGGVPRSSPLRSAPGRSVTPNLVDVHRIWRVPGLPRAVLAAVRRSHPAGLTINGSGSAGKHEVGEREVEYWWYVSFQAQPRPGLGSEVLAISTTAAPGGGTLLRADGEVVWLSARSAAERVPAGVSSIEVVRRAAYRRVTLRRTISAAAAVRRIVAALDELPIVQSGLLVCPEEPVGPAISLSFRGPAGRVLAAAVQVAGTEVGDCSPMHFSVGGRNEQPLAQGASVIDIISQTLGLRLLAG
jgi:hypothetical protein